MNYDDFFSQPYEERKLVTFIKKFDKIQKISISKLQESYLKRVKNNILSRPLDTILKSTPIITLATVIPSSGLITYLVFRLLKEAISALSC